MNENTDTPENSAPLTTKQKLKLVVVGATVVAVAAAVFTNRKVREETAEAVEEVKDTLREKL